MLVRALRRLGSHKVLDMDGAAGALLARANTPAQVLDILGKCQVAPSTKVFALRRIASTLVDRSGIASFEQSPIYARLREDVCAYIPTASYRDIMGMVFWIRVSKFKSPATFKLIAENDLKLLRKRVIEGANSGEFRGFQLIPLFHDFHRLNWDVNDLLPPLFQLISNPHELISLDNIAQLLRTCHMIKSKSLHAVYTHTYERMIKSNLALANLQDLIDIYEIAASTEVTLNLEVVRNIKQASLEAAMRKFGNAPIFVMTKVMKNLMKETKEISPLMALACEGINRQNALWPGETVNTVLQYCGKLKVMGCQPPQALITRAISEMRSILQPITQSKISELVGSMAVLRQKWPDSVLETLLSLRATLPKGDWSCFAAVVMADSGKDYQPFLGDLKELNRPDDLGKMIRLAAVLMLPSTPELISLSMQYEEELLNGARKYGGTSLLPVLLYIENRAILPICSAFPRFLKAYLSLLLPPKSIPTPEHLRFLFLCSPSFPSQVQALLSRTPISTNLLLQFIKSIHTVKKAEDLLQFVSWVRPSNVHVEVLANVIIKPVDIGRRTPAAHLFRDMLNRANGNIIECIGLNNHLEKLFEVIEEDPFACDKFLNMALEHIHLTADFAYLPLLDKLLELKPEAGKLASDLISLADSNSNYPELIVKIAKGQVNMYDSHLNTLSLHTSKAEICDKIAAVLLRGDQSLISALEASLKSVIRNYPVSFLASLFPKLRKCPQSDRFQRAIFEEIRSKWTPEVLLPGTCLGVLEAARSLRLSDPVITAANEYLSTRLQELSADQVLHYMYLVASIGFSADFQAITEAVEMLTTQNIGLYGQYILEVLYQMDLLETDMGKALVKQYLSTQNQRILPIKAIFPLLHANIPKTDLIPTLADRLNQCSPAQQLLYHLLTDSLTSSNESTLFSALTTAISTDKQGNMQLKVPNYCFTLCTGRLFGDLKWVAELVESRGVRIIAENGDTELVLA